MAKKFDYECALIYYVRDMVNLTPKEKELFEFIGNYQLKNGASPTVREMREHMGLKSDGFIVYCLKSLEKKHVIKKGDTPRSIKLLPSVSEKLHAPGMVRIPVLGNVPAGGPVLSEENIEEWISVGEDQVKNPHDCFILKVRGDSMIDTGIFEGDFVIASTKMQPKPRDIVIALVDGGSTVKRYMISDNGPMRGKPYLKPENPRYENIYPEEELEVQGVVIGMFRWY